LKHEFEQLKAFSETQIAKTKHQTDLKINAIRKTTSEAAEKMVQLKSERDRAVADAEDIREKSVVREASYQKEIDRLKQKAVSEKAELERSWEMNLEVMAAEKTGGVEKERDLVMEEFEKYKQETAKEVEAGRQLLQKLEFWELLYHESPDSHWGQLYKNMLEQWGRVVD